jgi:hypothetical protein
VGEVAGRLGVLGHLGEVGAAQVVAGPAAVLLEGQLDVGPAQRVRRLLQLAQVQESRVERVEVELVLEAGAPPGVAALDPLRSAAAGGSWLQGWLAWPRRQGRRHMRWRRARQ